MHLRPFFSALLLGFVPPTHAHTHTYTHTASPLRLPTAQGQHAASFLLHLRVRGHPRGVPHFQGRRPRHTEQLRPHVLRGARGEQRWWPPVMMNGCASDGVGFANLSPSFMHTLFRISSSSFLFFCSYNKQTILPLYSKHTHTHTTSTPFVENRMRVAFRP